jgi:hypothetical protein
MAAEPATAFGRGTVLGLISTHGHQASPGVADFVRLGAAAQHARYDAGAADGDALTRSTALWTAAHLDAGVAGALERHGATKEQLGRVLSLQTPPHPAEVEDVAVHDDLARALDVAFGAAPAPRTIAVGDIVAAILRDVVANGGLLGSRLSELKVDPAALLADLAEHQPAAEPVAKGRPAATTTRPPDMRASVSSATQLYLGFYEALRSLVPDADDARALWSAFGLVATRRRDTLATVVTTTVLGLRGERVSPRDKTAGLRAFDLPEGIEPVPVEHIDLARHALVARAGRVRNRVQPADSIHLRHVVAVALDDGSGPLGPETRDRDVEAVRAAFLRQLTLDAPTAVADRWRSYLEEAAASGHAAEAAPEAAEPPGRPVAGLDLDMVDDGTTLSDELRTVGDVVTLCDMLAARDAVPPISVGLFGRWGSGKSYFMALMRRRIDELQAVAVEAKARKHETSYCSQIVQVTFNAWHYMDADDLWATLAVHLFGAIAQIDPGDDRARPRAEVVRDLEAREREMEPVDRKIARALDDDRLDRAADTMGLAAERKDVLGMIGVAGTTIGYLSAVKALLTAPGWSRRRTWLVAGLGAALVLVVALAVLLVTGLVPVDWLVAWVPLAATTLGTATRWLRRIKDGLAEVNSVAAELGLQPHDVTAERIEKDARIRELRDELTRIDRLTGMRDWLQQRALSTDYTSHFGVISVLRGDLEALVEKQRRDAPDRRIILYIDDLDRCSPARVVEVLQAVHLLLAFPLFVAVVGVDPRWLLRSLERHYRELLSTPDGGAQRAVDDLITETTPHDYLEKIFQIPFSLRPMDAGGYGRLVASLAGQPAPGSSGTPDAGARGARDARDPDPSGAGAPPGPPPAGVSEPPAPAAAAPGEAVPEPSAAPAPAEPVAEVPAHAVVGPGPLAPVSANPPQLQITQAEVDALARMAPLIATPRAAKRLVNLYRLVRAGLPDREIDAFVTEARFRPLTIVLAAQVGFAAVSSRLLAQLVTGDSAARISERIDGMVDAPADIGVHAVDWESLRTALRKVCFDGDAPNARFDRPVAELQDWMPRLIRYSVEGALASSNG